MFCALRALDSANMFDIWRCVKCLSYPVRQVSSSISGLRG